MKALTLHQPWASFIAWGDKRFETRHWKTNYRGEIAIHAAKTMPAYAADFCHEPEIEELLSERNVWHLNELPCGVVVCIARLVACHQIPNRSLDISDTERMLGDWSPGRFAWELTMVDPLEEPIPARGAQGLWDWQAAA